MDELDTTRHDRVPQHLPRWPRPLRKHLSEREPPIDPTPCVAYDGCDSGYPVTWCLVEGQGHAIPSYSPTAIAEFFRQF